MANIQFGTGVLFSNPLTAVGNPPVNPTPLKYGLVQEVNVDFKGDLKKLYGQQQFPAATARGKIDVTIKGKLAVFDVTLLNQIFFAQAQTVGYNQIVDGEAQTVNTTVTASHTPLVADWGVIYSATGQPFVKVTGAPASGQYNVNATSGVYTFASGDNATAVKISYTYNQNATGASIALAGQLMGYAPELSMLFYNRFRNKLLGIVLNDVTVGSINLPSKLEDFWVSDFEASANLDLAGNLGTLFADLV
jgi:hypothetical protein